MKNVALLLMFASTIMVSQTFWQRSEPYSYGLNKIKFGGGDTVYGTLNSGFARSVDNGTTWTNPVVVNYVTDIALSPNGTIFLSENQQRMSRSTNKGNSWTVIGTGITETSCSSVLVTSVGTVIAGTLGGIYRSTNNGTNWNKVAGGVQLGADTSINTMASYDGKTLFAFTRLNASPDHGFTIRSTDDGATWTKSSSSLDTVTIYRAIVHSNGTIYVRTGSGAYYSTTNGDSWNLLGFKGTYIGDVAIDSLGAVYATVSSDVAPTDSIVFKTTNNGASWTTIKTPGMGITGLQINKKGDLFISQDQTYRSSDNGNNWKGLPVLYPDARNFFQRSNGDLYISTGATYGNLYRSTDNGVTWKFQKTNTVGTPMIGFLNDTMYVSDTYYQGSVTRSIDGGKTFKQAWTGLSGYVNQLFGTKFKSVLAGTSNGIYRTTDGTNWVKTSSFAENIPFRQSANGTLFAARNNGGGVVRSNDSGSSWTAVTTGLTNLFVRGMEIAPNGDIYTSTDAGIFRSTNAGDQWVKIDTQANKPYGEFLAINRDGKIMVAGSDNSTFKEVYQSTNSGASWSMLSDELFTIDNSANVRQLFVAANGTLFAGTVNGVFRSKNVTTGITRSDETYPKGFALEQNYPNPFNPSTTIRWTVASSAQVSLKVFDLLGREVEVLIDRNMEAGSYQVRFDASHFSSGIYFYTLRSGTMTFTRKMTLLK